MRLKDATAAWTEKHGDVRLSVPKRYNEKSFREALAMRRRERDNLQDLELLILDWLSDASKGKQIEFRC
jgi:hypothetical protein